MLFRKIVSQLKRISSQLNINQMTSQELLDGLTALKVQEDASRVEILAKIASLEAAVGASANISPEVAAAFDALKASVQAVDDIVPAAV